MYATTETTTETYSGKLSRTELWQLLQAERQGRTAAETELTQLRQWAILPQRNPNPVLRLSLEGRLEYANPQAEFLRPELERAGQSWLQDQLRDATRAALASGHPERRTLTIGRQYFVFVTVAVPADNYALLYFNDTTVQHQAETQLQEQYAFYETLMEHLPAVVVVLGPDQRYRFLNHYAAPDPAERQARIGTTFADHCTAAGLPRRLVSRRRRLFEQAAQARTLVAWEEEWPATTANGRARHWQCYYQPVYGPGKYLQVMMCYGIDVTTQRMAEEKSRASEAAVRAQQEFTARVLDLNPNGIYVRDKNQRFLFQNQALRQLQELILARSQADPPTIALSEADMAAYAAVDEEVRRTNRPVRSEDRMTLGDGEVRWFQTVKCPLPSASGELHVLGVSTDITELKTAQQAAEAAAVARENFLANMSHEIRTPLNGVLGMAGLLAKTDLSAQQLNFVGIIEQSGQHLLSVVNDVLDMAKITSGKLEMEQLPFNLCDAMGQALTPLLTLATEKGLHVVGTLLRESCPHPWVLGDAHRLRQIMLNLVSNAIKFTAPGGTVTVGGYQVSETATTLTAEFRVTDTGIGIADDKLETIFQEFTQAYADTSRQFGGTGLGLSISRALVQQLGGQLVVQSALGQGSTFSFEVTLPKAAPAAVRQAQLAPAPAPAAGLLRGRRVLLVEDNAVNREVAQLVLEGHGVLVDTAESGLEALEKFEISRYDIILMDIQMPGMNGLDATARIRQYPDASRAATPVLALTANAFKADAEKYRAAGLNDTLSKPFAETELLAKIAALLGGPALPPAAEPAEARPAAGLAEPGEAATETATETVAAHPAAAPLYDLALLRATAHGSQPFIDRVMAAFRKNTPLSLNALWAAVAVADLPAAVALAHKLGPSLQLVGAQHLVRLVAVLEDETATATARIAAAAPLAEGLEELLAALAQDAEAG